MSDGNEYIDVDWGLQLIGWCKKCGDPVLENEGMIYTEAGLCCEKCSGLQEEMIDE